MFHQEVDQAVNLLAFQESVSRRMAPVLWDYTMALASNFQEQSPMIRILIADDSAAIRDSLASCLNPASGFQVVGLAGDGLEAVEKAGELLPDVVIMDAQMPNMDGVEATRRIKSDLPGVGILFFRVFADYMEASMSAGSDGYLNKDCSPSELFNEIRRIASGSQANS